MASEPISALAHLGLVPTLFKAMGLTRRAAYEDFLTLGKDADSMQHVPNHWHKI